MKKFTFILFTIAFILGACAPQATATPEATLTPTPPPTKTPIPTPTLHPQFAALQEQITQSGRFTLNPDGTIFDGAEPIPGLTVAPDGTMTLTVDGETVTLDPTKAVFDDETGFSYPGYEQDEEDNWVAAIPLSPAQEWAEANNGQFDAEHNVAWDPATGLVMWGMDANGEWVNYPDGNVPIPPGPGYENEPPLPVPFYHSFNEAIAAITDKLPWGELAESYREAQVKDSEHTNNTYWRPIGNNGTWTMTLYGRIGLHDRMDPGLRAEVFVSEMQLPDGGIGIRLNYQSDSTNHYHEDVLIIGDSAMIIGELQRIDGCVSANTTAPDLAELCKSDTVTIEAPVK